MSEWLIFILVNFIIGITPVVSPVMPAAVATSQPGATAVPVLLPAGQPVRFASLKNPNQLDTALTFEPGSARGSHYDVIVNAGMLTLIAGPNDLTGPSVCYTVSGDFEAQVYMRIEPHLNNAQGTGMFVRLPGDWKYHLGIVRRDDGNIQQIATPGRDSDGDMAAGVVPYLASGLFLKIERHGSSYILSYKDGVLKDWQALRTETDFSELPALIDLCLNTWSGDERSGITGIFGDFYITPLAPAS